MAIATRTPGSTASVSIYVDLSLSPIERGLRADDRITEHEEAALNTIEMIDSKISVVEGIIEVADWWEQLPEAQRHVR